MSKTAADPLQGSLLDGRYRVGRRIARGGMATVYEATDTRLNRLIALKVLHHDHAGDPDFADRFVREAHATARLSHPNVVAVFDQGNDNGTLFLAMEFVPGITLRDLLREQGQLSPQRALELLEPILSALAAAHGAGFVHRDVKPENVLLTPEGTVKVADFGLARAVTATTNTTHSGGVLIGTVSYVAPELVVDGSADARSDVYSAGVMLYEMLTGQKPHQGETPIQVAYKHVHEDVPAPSAQVLGIPPYLDALVARATARQRDSRTVDANVFLHQIQRVRNALQEGVYDDPQLTEDLIPTSRIHLDDEGHEDTVSVPLDGHTGDAATPQTAVAPQPAAWSWPITSEPAPPGAEPTLQVHRSAAPAVMPEPYITEQRRKRRSGWLTLVLVLLLAAAATAAGWYYGVGRFMETPNLVGMPLAQAERALADSTLALETTYEFSETVPKGEIISTDPAPGDRVLREGTIDATVSKGKERYEMPTVTGQTLAKAENLLEKRNLQVGSVTEAYHDSLAEGLVISASHEAGSKLKRDTEIDLVVSLGPEPIEVPDVVGDDLADVRAELSALGLKTSVEREYSDEIPAGAVISQDPAEGTTLYKGDAVSLVVSEGPELVEVPSVWGEYKDAAKQILKDAGFKVKQEHADGYIGFDLVATQDPEAGSMAPRGSTVTIHLY